MAYSDALSEMLIAAERAAEVSGTECDISVRFAADGTRFTVELKEISDDEPEEQSSERSAFQMLDEMIFGDCLQYYGDMSELVREAEGDSDSYTEEERFFLSQIGEQIEALNGHLRMLIQLTDHAKYGECD